MSDFVATIRPGARGGALVAVPEEVIASLGGGGRIPVKASFDGVDYTGSVVRMGGDHVIGVLKEIRAATGKDIGDDVTVSLERDASERVVEVPIELRDALAANPAAAAAFAALSYSHQREHAAHVVDAKGAETRKRRAEKAVAMLLKP
jgi:hypothetical protein